MDGVRVIRFRYAPRRLQTLVHDGGMLANLRASVWKWFLLPGFMAGMAHVTWKQLRRDDIDVVHAHWLIPQGFAAVLAQAFRRRKRPLMVTSHGADLFALDTVPVRAVKRMVARRAAALAVVSEAMRIKAAALGFDGARISVRPMGVDMARFSAAPAPARSDVRLLFVGRLVEKKGVRYLLEAMPSVIADIPAATLAIAGFGPEEGMLREQAQRMGLGGRVEFLGAVPQQDLPGLYRDAAALVVPFVEAEGGDQEGLGLVMVEALSCGCPVVTTSLPAVRDVFGGARPEYCATPRSASSLAVEIVRLLRERERARASARALQEDVRERFDWDRVARGYAELLSSLVKK